MNLANVANLRTQPETGTWYRAVNDQYRTTPLLTNYSRRHPSRFKPGTLYRPHFEVLYLARTHAIAMEETEVTVTLSNGHVFSNPNHTWLFLNVQVQLTKIIDLTDVAQQAVLDTNAQELTGDWRGYHLRSLATPVSTPTGVSPTQELGAAIYKSRRAEGFLYVSARKPHEKNLVVFPKRLLPGRSFVRYTDSHGNQHEIP